MSAVAMMLARSGPAAAAAAAAMQVEDVHIKEHANQANCM
jgi:hypothetical protein